MAQIRRPDLNPASRLLAVVLIVGMLTGVLAVAATGVFAELAGVPSESLTREPQTVLGGAAHVGAMSNLGVLAFGVAAVAAGLTATVVRGRARGMFAAASIVTSLMLLDDLYLLHDAVYPKIGVPETAVQAAYLLAIAAIVLRWRAELGWVALSGIGLTLAFWALSIGMDTFLNNHPLNVDQLVEDGAKFVGIAVWASVWAALAHLALRRDAPVRS